MRDSLKFSRSAAKTTVDGRAFQMGTNIGKQKNCNSLCRHISGGISFHCLWFPLYVVSAE